MSLWKRIEELAVKKVDGRPLKEIFSYDGVSFWWRLKNMVVEKTVRDLNSVNFHLKCTMRYRAGLEKDRFVGRFFKGRGPKNPKIVVLSLLRNKNKYFREVEEELIRRKADFSMLLYLAGLPKPKEVSKPGGYTLEGFLDKEIINEEREVRTKFMKLADTLAKEIECPGIVDYAVAKLYAQYFTEKEIPEAFRLQRMAENMIKSLKPRCILLTSEDGKHSYPTIVAARKHCIKTIALAHGTSGIKSGQTYYRLKENKPLGYMDLVNMVEPDFYLSYGELDRRQILEMGCYAPERIIPIGQPRTDSLVRFMKNTDKKALLEKHGLPPEKRILLWATQTHMTLATTEDNEKKASMTYSAMKDMADNWRLAIKLHPSEDRNAPLYKKHNATISKDSEAKIFYSRDPELTWELICASDAVMISLSSVGTEAIMMNRPLLLIDPAGKYDLSYYTSLGVDMVVRKKEDIVGYLQTIESEGYGKKFTVLRQNFLKQACTNFGHSAEKITDFLEEQAK